MAVNIVIQCFGGAKDGLLIRMDQHEEPSAVIALPGDQCEHFYELKEVPSQYSKQDLIYVFSRSMKRVVWDAEQDNWPDPPIDEAY